MRSLLDGLSGEFLLSLIQNLLDPVIDPAFIWHASELPLPIYLFAFYLCCCPLPGLLNKILPNDSVLCCLHIANLYSFLTLIVLVIWCFPARLLLNSTCDPGLLSTGLGKFWVPSLLCFMLIGHQHSQVHVPCSSFLSPVPFHCPSSPCPNFQGCWDGFCEGSHPNHLKLLILVHDIPIASLE